MYNQDLTDQATQMVSSMFKSLRNNILTEDQYPWQEVSLVLDCIIKMRTELKPLLDMEEKDIALSMKDLYNQSFKSIIDERFEADKYYTLPNFNLVINHLSEQKTLKRTLVQIVNDIRFRQRNWENAIDDEKLMIFDCGYSPEKCLDELITQNKLSCTEYSFVERNAHKQFFICKGDCTFFITNEMLNSYDPSRFLYDDVTFFEDALCIWPFSDGYARIIGKNGKWGYISYENNHIKWLDDTVLYADDFNCERARIQLNDSNNSYMFLGLCLEDCFNKKYWKATEFKDGFAIVSDDFCDDYRIDVFGNIAEEDKERYVSKKQEVMKSTYYPFQKTGKRRSVSYDYENEIMDSLSGHGADPDIFGF